MAARKAYHIAIAAVIVGLSTLAVLLLRDRADTEWRPSAESAREATELIERFRGASHAPVSDRETIIAAFEAAPYFDGTRYSPDGDAIETDSPTGTPTPEQARALWRTVSEYLSVRAEADPLVYAEWMKNRGYSLRPLDADLDGIAGVNSTHQGYLRRFRITTGREITPEDSPWTIFRDAFAGEARVLKTTPVALSTDSDAFEIWYGVAEDSDGAPTYEIQTPSLSVFYAKARAINESTDTTTHWVSGIQHNGWPHWSPPVSIEELLQRHGRIITARVHYVIHTNNNSILPTAMIFFLDPANGVWHIPDRRSSFVYVNTYSIPLGTGPEF